MILLSTFLFLVGIFLVLTRRNAVMVLIGIELIFNAANLNFVFFATRDELNYGIYFALFVIAITAAETALGVAILLNLYKTHQTIQLDELNKNLDEMYDY
ncbi:MAG: NADH-quinone oxidoreductase subunit NuoK [Candidatus Pacearchaeota archaeon]